jgi:micrococcal nuclease
MRRIALCIAVLATACGNPSKAAPAATPDYSPNATMDYVIDGDTIDVVIDGAKQRVRLIGVDTPETKKPNTPVQCFGPEATTFTKSLLAVDTPVHLVRDVVARDDYGRMLAYVYLSDGSFINMQIIRSGYARPLTIPPNDTHATEFVAAAQSAQAEHIGLWAACSG